MIHATIRKRKMVLVLLTVILAFVSKTSLAQCQFWETVGSPGFANTYPHPHKTAIAPSGTPYLMFRDMDDAGKIKVKKYTSGIWTTVGAPLSTEFWYNGKVALSSTGVPYASYGSWDSGMFLKYFDGSSWVSLGTEAFPNLFFDLDFALGTDNLPYVVYSYGEEYDYDIDEFINPLTVKKYNGSSWVTVGAANFVSGPLKEPHITVGPDGTPYVFFMDSTNKGTVVKYNGSSWVTVGSGGFTDGKVQYTNIAVSGSGTIYVAYRDEANAGSVSVMNYNGTDWVVTGSLASDSDVTSVDMKLAPDGLPYVTCVAYYANRDHVYKYDGATWRHAGEILKGGTWSSINVNGSGTAYVCFNDQDNGGLLTMKALTASGSVPSITGATLLCPNATTTMSNSQAGGTWSSSDPAVISVKNNQYDGVFAAVTTGTATITYMVGSCYATKVVSVTASGLAGTISGAGSVCSGSSISLSTTGTGGTWSVFGTTVATVGSATGVVTGSIAGVTVVSYSVGSCAAVHLVTVNPYGGDITGPLFVAEGATISLANEIAGGTWSVSSSNASINSSGVVTGISAGTTVVTYSTAGSCGSTYSTKEITITPASPACHSWTAAGAPNISSGYTADMAIHMDAAGVPYMSYREWYASTGHAYVRKFDGSQWVSLNLETVTGNPDLINAAVTPSGTVYATGVVDFYQLRTYKYENDAWQLMPSIAEYSDGAAIFADNAGNVYETYYEFDNDIFEYALRVGKFNGTGWDDLGVVGYNSMYGIPSLAFSGSTPYALLVDPTNDYKITVRRYNGSSWVNVGTPLSVSSTDYSAPTLAVDNIGVAYLCLSGSGSWILPYVLKFNGTSWVDVSGPLTNIVFPRIVMGKNDVPYLTGFNGGAVVGTQVLKYNGSTWTSLGIAQYNTQWPTAAIDANGIVFVGDNTNTYSPSSSFSNMALKYTPANGVAPITGTTTICLDVTTTLSNADIAGVWSNSDDALAAMTEWNNDRVLYGLDTGTVTISYTIGTCAATTVVTVGAAVSVPGISGTPTLCQGYTTTLDDSMPGGTWSSSDETVATVDGSGLVTGVTPGTAIIRYTITACGSSAAEVVVTVNSASALGSISGSGTVCAGNTTTLGNSTPAGSWSSSDVSVATVGTSSGVVIGITPGTATLTYTVVSSCGTATATKVVTVNAALSAGTITGATTVCASNTTTLNNATTGGTWSSSNTSVATIGSATGIVSGVTAGNATITYTVTSSGCGSATTTAVVTVNGTPSAGTITGTASVCPGNTTILNNATSGGTWSSSNASVATVGSSTGIVSGVTAGNVTVTYTVTTGCGSATTTRVVTVNAATSAGPVTGAGTLCVGATATLSNAVSGGTWSSSDDAVATVGSSSGIVTGVSTGNATITYTVSGACGSASATAVVTVGATASITGSLALCNGMTSSLSGGTTGGVWTSSNTAVATIGAANGVLTAVSTGTSNITYAMSSGCTATAVVTVSAPALIAGTSNACVGQTATLTDATTGGVWSSANTSLATVDASTGVVSGVAAGTATISYVVSAGCYRTIAFTVKALPPAIAAPVTVCAGSTVYVAPPSTNGYSWTSSNTSVAVIGSSTGMLTGVSAGTTTLTYTTNTGCFVTTEATVNTAPAAISGTLALCSGSTSSLSSATVGGTWSSSNNSVAAIGSATGVFTAGSTGSATISYTVGGCRTTAVVTVSAIAAITGTPSVCVGSSTTLSNASAGGTWSSSDAGIASVGTSGVLTGVSAGNATITYTLASGCIRTVTATVVATPAGITGTLGICPSTTSTLSGGTAGGTWSGGNATIATINSSTGVLSGIGAGTINVSYTLTGCRVTAIATVNPLPAVITGTINACVAQTSTLNNATPGGAWSSANTGIATVDPSTGVVTGVSAATTTMTYTLGTGCYRTIPFTVKALPPAIATTAAACVGTTTYIAPPSTNGRSWSSSNTAIATIGSSTGIMSGVSTGTTILTYTATTGCYVTTEATVYALPSAGVITGPTSVIVGNTITLNDAAGGGVWSSSNTARATIGAATGIVTGVAGGSATISYSVSNPGCTVRATQVISVSTSRPGGSTVSVDNSLFRLYPNPTMGVFTVEVEEAGTFSIYALDGKEVNKYNIATGINQLTLSNDLASGIYMCRFTSETGNTTMVRLIYKR